MTPTDCMRFLLVAARRAGSFSRRLAAPAMARKTMAEPIVDHGSLFVALCLPEIRQAPSRGSSWDDGVPGTDPLPLFDGSNDAPRIVGRISNGQPPIGAEGL